MLLNTKILTEFKKNLLKLREDIINEISENNHFLQTKSEVIGNSDLIDQSFNYSNKELSAYLNNGDQKRLQEINEALIKLYNKQYGKCSFCYKLIDINRLYAIPYTNCCLDCKKKNF